MGRLRPERRPSAIRDIFSGAVERVGKADKQNSDIAVGARFPRLISPFFKSGTKGDFGEMIRKGERPLALTSASSAVNLNGWINPTL